MTSPPPRHTGFSRYVEAEDADILIVTETKTPEIKLAALDDRYEYRFWGDHTVKKGQAGTAIFSKIKPLNVTRGFTESDEVTAADSEGRMITLEFDNSYVVGTCAWCEPSLSLLLFLLRPSVASPFTDAFPRSDAPDVPNAGAGLKSLPDKEKWNRAFETYLRSLDAKKPIVWAGDLNVVPSPLDIRNWKTNYNKSAGCTDAEIEGFKRQLNPEEGTGHGRLVDVWRARNPDKDCQGWSYYAYKFQCREKGIGWRLDYQVVRSFFTSSSFLWRCSTDATSCSHTGLRAADAQGQGVRGPPCHLWRERPPPHRPRPRGPALGRAPEQHR